MGGVGDLSRNGLGGPAADFELEGRLDEGGQLHDDLLLHEPLVLGDLVYASLPEAVVGVPFLFYDLVGVDRVVVVADHLEALQDLH